MVLTKKIINLYYKHTFKVATFLMDPEFDPIWDNIEVIQRTIINTTSTNDHVPEIEQTFMVLKE